MRNWILLLSIFLNFSTLFASENSAALNTQDRVEFTKPETFDFITHVPDTLSGAWKMSFNSKPETLKVWGGMLASTVVLFIYDEQILREFKRLGRATGIGNDDHTKSMIRAGDISLLRGPTDVGSWLYFLGDGWTHTAIGFSFIASGAINSDNRALQTGTQLFNGMISSTIVNQIAKRSFGRESPYRSTAYRGKWRFFPSFSEYNNNTSKYDAMPTGHLMTATMTWTVIDANYPEYKSWIRPLAFVYCTLLGSQMVNNGVHWASDYPLGIAMGYVFGKVASEKGRIYKKGQLDNQEHSTENSEKGKITNLSNWEFLPIAYSQNNYKDRTYGVLGVVNF